MIGWGGASIGRGGASIRRGGHSDPLIFILGGIAGGVGTSHL